MQLLIRDCAPSSHPTLLLVPTSQPAYVENMAEEYAGILISNLSLLATLSEVSFNVAVSILRQEEIINVDQQTTVSVSLELLFSFDFEKIPLQWNSCRSKDSLTLETSQAPLLVRDRIQALDKELTDPKHKLRFVELLRDKTVNAAYIANVSCLESSGTLGIIHSVCLVQKILPDPPMTFAGDSETQVGYRPIFRIQNETSIRFSELRAFLPTATTGSETVSMPGE